MSRKIPVAVLLCAALGFGFQAAKKSAPAKDPLIAGFERSTVASVADAVDQITGQRGFLSHDMRPRTGNIRVVGRATTALLRPAPPEKATPALSTGYSTAMIDNSKPGDVGVIVIEDGLDVAGIGGLMSTAAKARGMAGVIVDGGVRDLKEVRGLGLPIYARSVVPSSTVSRFAGVAKDVPVRCAGVEIQPGDIIVADEDGVVRVPKDRADEVLRRAQEIDERETKMVPYIQKFRTLTKAVEVFNRI
ncbi:MAG: RraA family protein [Acidobacteria bacterium]|nr:RraA family protein [Acidobacteriota bacterium]